MADKITQVASAVTKLPDKVTPREVKGLKPKLRLEIIPGVNTKNMVESISAKLRKGPIPERSDQIPVRPIHQVPARSAIGKLLKT